MTQAQINIIKHAFKILSKEFGYPKNNCKGHVFGCVQCRVKLFLDDYKCVIEDAQEMNNLK